jgi:hypothetical protein
MSAITYKRAQGNSVLASRLDTCHGVLLLLQARCLCVEWWNTLSTLFLSVGMRTLKEGRSGRRGGHSSFELRTQVIAGRTRRHAPGFSGHAQPRANNLAPGQSEQACVTCAWLY